MKILPISDDLLTVNGTIPQELDFRHLRRMTNEIGMAQHAKYAIPDYRHGYCMDDNCRALMLCGMANTLYPARYDHLIDRYLAFMYYMQREDGQFRNFLSFDHQFLDENGTEDAFGRTIWALGSLMKNESRPHAQQLAKEMLDKAFPHIATLRSLRAMAYSLTGLVTLWHSGRYDKDLVPTIQMLADTICKEYAWNATTGWYWYESIITYDNAILPYSLFLAVQLLDEERYYAYGLESALFLDRLLYGDGDVLHLVGNEGWYTKGGTKAVFGQQAIEIPSLILMYRQLVKYREEAAFHRKAESSFMWFHGNNYLGAELFDPDTRGCRDGIDEFTVNQNQGAESCICYWQAFLYQFHQLD